MDKELQTPFAVISDIHSNLDALEAVFADIDSRGVKEVVCLGDVLGYGPQPLECLDLIAERCSLCLLGNHDYAVLYEPFNFNLGAESACFWTRSVMEKCPDIDARNRRWDYMGNMVIKVAAHCTSEALGDITLVHGSPRRPVNEYVFPDDVYTNPSKVSSVFDRFGRICFVGHTHVPGVLFDTPDFYTPDELDYECELGKNFKSLVNVGSVGQPRDRDRRASYVTVDDEKISFHRVEYDVEAVAEKIKAIGELDNYLGDRLLEGR